MSTIVADVHRNRQARVPLTGAPFAPVHRCDRVGDICQRGKDVNPGDRS